MRRYLSAMLAVLFLLCLGGCTKTTDTLKSEKSTVMTGDLSTTGSTAGTTAGQQHPTGSPDGCMHENVQEATCVLPALCLDCNQQLSEPLGHAFLEKSCTRCGKKNPNYTPRVEVIGIKLDQTEVDMLIGETVTLEHTLNPANATDKEVTWKSSNPSIATVSEDGTVTAVAVGEATITVTSLNGKTTGCKIRVMDMVVQMPYFPLELVYNAQHNGEAIYIRMESVDYTFTQTAPNKGTLMLMFDGLLSRAGDGDGGFTYPNFGWRLYDNHNTLVAESTAQSEESLAIGSSIVGLTAEIPSLDMGEYLLELYSTYVWEG